MKNKIVFSVLTALSMYVFAGCQFVNPTPTLPARTCAIEDLLLADNEFPEGFIADSIGSPLAEMPEESAGRTAGYSHDLFYQKVGRYSSLLNASRKYEEQYDLSFAPRNDVEWVHPDRIQYTSPTANQYHIACDTISKEYQCRMIGQYEEYFVFSFAYISESGISFEIYQDILQKIDEKMSECIK